MSCKKYTVGGVEASSPIWLAPLAGVTTRTFREFHARLGAGLVHTEMISATGLSYKNNKTSRMLGDESERGPVIIQLFGPDSVGMLKGAEAAFARRRYDAVQINMACPMPKVTKKSGGASLLGFPSEAADMVKKLKSLGVPVWVKLRLADPRAHPMPTGDFCELMLASGADLLLLHGRTPSQRYEGVADKNAVCDVAARFPGLVAGSGDFYSPDDARRYLDGGCVAALAARGVMRDAFLIPKTLAELGFQVDAQFSDPTPSRQIEALIEMAREATRHEGERFALVMAHRMLSGILKGLPGASALRQACASCWDFKSFEENLLRWTPGNTW
ncbi:MAG: tRNA-dihydrouridine synthase family protein [Synergistaceae bacterium]|jgi:tRNA-dihydrouridine synthase B|nr:tRNA-dihydrouridine synthase family protein [Synergistaceae bacterium]